jgi:hypothetical protein
MVQNFLQVKIINIHQDDIVDGNPKITLALIWIIILHFQVKKHYIEIDTCTVMPPLY